MHPGSLAHRTLHSSAVPDNGEATNRTTIQSHTSGSSLYSSTDTVQGMGGGYSDTRVWEFITGIMTQIFDKLSIRRAYQPAEHSDRTGNIRTYYESEAQHGVTYYEGGERRGRCVCPVVRAHTPCSLAGVDAKIKRERVPVERTIIKKGLGMRDACVCDG